MKKSKKVVKIVKILKELRERKGITQEELSKILSVSRSCVAKWENNDIYPHAKIIYRISQILGCSTDVLICPYSDSRSLFGEKNNLSH